MAVDEYQEEANTGEGLVCLRCGGEAHAEQVRIAIWDDDRLIVVEDVPAIVCDDCFERHYDDVTAYQIDQLRAEHFPLTRARGMIEAPVFSLNDCEVQREDFERLRSRLPPDFDVA